MIAWAFKLFLLIYGIVACVSILTQNLFFTEYGIFYNHNPTIQLLITVTSLIWVWILIKLSYTKKFLPINTIIISHGLYWCLYAFYCLVFVYFLVGFISDAHYYVYIESNIAIAMAHVGHTVANLESKRNFAFLYFLCFIFPIFSYSGRGLIGTSSIFISGVLFVVFLLSGRKEQAISSLIAFLISINAKHKINIKFLLLILLVLVGGIFILLNSVRGGASDNIYDFFMASQEFYPVIYGSYIRLFDGQSLQLIPFESYISTFVPMLEKLGYPNALVYLSQAIFNEYGYGPTFSIVGLLSIAPIFTSVVLFFLFIVVNVFNNSITRIGLHTRPIVFYIFIKLFFLFRNGLVYYFVWDVIILLLFSFLAIFFVEKGNEERCSCSNIQSRTINTR